MKLWQRIFLTALLLVILATTITGWMIQSKNFRSTIQQEKERAAAAHANLAAGISSQIVYQRMLFSLPALGEKQVQQIAGTFLNENIDISGAALYLDGTVVQIYPAQAAERAKVFVDSIQEKDVCLQQIIHDAHSVYLMNGSILTIEEKDYLLYTEKSLNALYAAKAEQMRMICYINLLTASVIAVLLLVTTYLHLRPLSAIQIGLEQITQGDYHTRIKSKGAVELRQLAAHINDMAEATEQHMEQLQQTADSRKQFVDSFAHELKTPLTSIMGFGDLMRVTRSMDAGMRQEYAQIIVTEAKRLQTLSGKLLQLATAEHVQTEQQQVFAAALFEEIRVATAPMCLHNRVRLSVHCDKTILTIDKELFKSLLYNLIDNAVKASHTGSEIRLSCKTRRGKSIIAVEDHGIGMNAQQLQHATEPFYMADKARSRKENGAGLGLSLCSEIAHLHNTQLHIRSHEGKGTIVWLVMPTSGG